MFLQTFSFGAGESFTSSKPGLSWRLVHRRVGRVVAKHISAQCITTSRRPRSSTTVRGSEQKAPREWHLYRGSVSAVDPEK